MKKIKSRHFLPEVEGQLIEQLRQGLSLTDVFAPLLKGIIEASLAGELTAHLEAEKADGFANRRNGQQRKTVRSEYGPVEIETSRDRLGSFEPQVIGKHQRQFRTGMEEHILSLYSFGMSYDNIRTHLKKLYDVELSDAYLSSITDSVQQELEAWRNRPLEAAYAIVWLDGIRFKVREHQGRVVQKTVYVVVGVDLQGKRDILAFCVGEVESSKYWLQVLTQLRARGVKDIFIACTDNLAGFGEAIEAAFPDCLHQLCIVHQIRNSLKYLPYKDYKEFAADLKKIYQAVDEEQALVALADMETKWGSKYAIAIANWRRDWHALRTFFQFGDEIRRLIYTTNTVEGVNRQIRKNTKTKGAFTSEDALKKLLFVTIRNITAKWDKPIYGWKTIYLQFCIHFKERILRLSADLAG